ncbi:MAG: aromatic/alkene monooxygenase hydroxylase subunit beta [Anaeromyxobacter sp.]
MQIDLRTVSITPLRQTFDNLAARLGGDKAVSRYLEATLDVQASANFHYRPTWDPEHEIFDPSRTKIAMKDWYAFKDPRQLYYGTYTQSRAKLQETAEGDFEFVESRGLAASLDPAVKQAALGFYVPLRHVAWGANMNGAAMCAYGYGTGITQPCLYQGMDQLGIAQYLTRLAFTLGSPADLEAGKKAWLSDPAWQELRRYVEDTLVVKDWFELFVAQNVALDGVLYPLAYREVDRALAAKAGPTLSMLTRFQADWFEDASKWVDSVLKIAAAESPANKAQLAAWISAWRARAMKALEPVAKLVLPDGQGLAAAAAHLDARVQKAGI